MYKLVDQLHAGIEILIKGHPSALKFLTGEADPPTTRQIIEIISSYKQKKWLQILGTRVDASFSDSPEALSFIRADTFLDIFQKAGGWNHIAIITNSYKTHNKSYWNIFKDYVNWVEKVPTDKRGHNPRIKVLSNRCGYSVDHLKRLRRQIPRDIAKIIVFADVSSEMEV
jgi:hypothetical protein